MEDSFIDITIKEPKTKTIRIALPKFTLIGATTKAGALSKPLRDRFGIMCAMDYYTNEEIAKIIRRSSKVIDLSIDDESIVQLSKMCRSTPRIANRLLKRVRDYVLVKCDGRANIDAVNKCMSLLEINENGLDKTDIQILKALQYSFGGKAVGLETLSHFIGEDAQSIEDMSEPYLIKEGYIARTPRGRIITEKGSSVIKETAE